MRTYVWRVAVFLAVLIVQLAAPCLFAQSAADSGTISGTITDPSGAVVAGATVTISNPVSQYSKSAGTDHSGHFQVSWATG